MAFIYGHAPLVTWYADLLECGSSEILDTALSPNPDVVIRQLAIDLNQFVIPEQKFRNQLLAWLMMY
ncbi:MAG: hypothetical protein DYH20_05295 [Gammaproteobacteria bacterium PRO9]|nr:hypothetical protein [Gammaproteobacteria bacterium PRO9]